MNERSRFLIVGAYAWVAAVYFGGVFLDKVYADHLKSVLGISESSLVFSEISDTLLCIGFVMVISALGAIAVSWKSRVARNIFIASLFAFSFEILIPTLFSITKTTLELLWIRPLPSGIASILAFIGMYKYDSRE
jgi:hypothetical protein